MRKSKGKGSKFKIDGGDGKYYYLYAAIDRSTRHVFVKLEKDLSSKTATKFLKDFKEQFPHKIRVVPTDNGSEFTDKFNDDKINKPKGKPSGEHEFDKLCKELNIERRYIKPGKQQTNVMVERFNRRIAEYMRTKPKEMSSFDSIKDFIYNFANNYNNTKLKVIDYSTPRDLFYDHYHEEDSTQGEG